jgi:hypothetical protein
VFHRHDILERLRRGETRRKIADALGKRCAEGALDDQAFAGMLARRAPAGHRGARPGHGPGQGRRSDLIGAPPNWSFQSRGVSRWTSKAG